MESFNLVLQIRYLAPYWGISTEGQWMLNPVFHCITVWWSNSFNTNPATQLSNGQFKLTGTVLHASGNWDSTVLWLLKRASWTQSQSEDIPLTSNLLWSGWLRVLIGVEVGDGICCGDPDDWYNYWGHSGGETWGRAKEKLKCWDVLTNWFNGWNIDH